MGTKQNTDATILTGILLPMAFDPDFASDDQFGTDFAEADPQPQFDPIEMANLSEFKPITLDLSGVSLG